jgi:hypothetical protein
MGDLLYLVSIAFVGATTVGLFFGSGFMLLGQPGKQMHAEPGIQDRNTNVDPLHSSELFASVKFGEPSSEGVSTASEATIVASAQVVTPSGPPPNSEATSVPPPRGLGSDHLRKLQQTVHSRSGAMPGKARATASHTGSRKQDREPSPEKDAADTANQQEYNQLHATGPAANFAVDAPSR